MAFAPNPNFNWTRFGGNALQDIGVGLTQAPTISGGIGRGTQINQAQQPARDAAARLEAEDAAKQKAIADQAANRAKYADMFQTQGAAPLLIDMVRNGDADPAAVYWDMQKANQPGDPSSTIGGRAQLAQTWGLQGDEAKSYVLTGKLPESGKPTTSMQEYDFARSQGYNGTFQQYETDMKKAGATNIDFNQNQGVAAGFADRMASANAILSDPKLLPAMTDPVKPALGAIPGAGNYLVGPEYQSAEQAQRDFVNAILRRESGAVISPSEFENAKKQYFPQPGDGPDVIRQKADNRRIAIEGVQRAAGPNYQVPALTPPGVQPVDDLLKKYGVQ